MELQFLGHSSSVSDDASDGGDGVARHDRRVHVKPLVDDVRRNTPRGRFWRYRCSSAERKRADRCEKQLKHYCNFSHFFYQLQTAPGEHCFYFRRARRAGPVSISRACKMTRTHCATLLLRMRCKVVLRKDFNNLHITLKSSFN